MRNWSSSAPAKLGSDCGQGESDNAARKHKANSKSGCLYYGVFRATVSHVSHVPQVTLEWLRRMVYELDNHLKSAKTDNPGGTTPRQSSINHWIRNWRSRQLLFQRIYNCRKSRNADPSAAAVAEDFMPRLGATWYAGLWLAHKITKPLSNLRRWCQKTLRPRPTEVF